jgi:hypothetical protein
MTNQEKIDSIIHLKGTTQQDHYIKEIFLAPANKDIFKVFWEKYLILNDYDKIMTPFKGKNIEMQVTVVTSVDNRGVICLTYDNFIKSLNP